MSPRDVVVALGILLGVGTLAAGCGGSTTATTTSATPPKSPPSATASAVTKSAPTTVAPTTTPSSGALTPEAQATATGDVPDNQVFLTFSNRGAGYSIKYPEGWAQRGSGRIVTFQDKNNLVRITVSHVAPPSLASVTTAMTRLGKLSPSLRFGTPTSVALRGSSAVKVVYSTRSAPNPVTGKRVELVVDRYYVPGAGRVAVVDLGTPQGVDNVDAYRLMIESFRWR
jgi:hypothetical protein